jgi:HEAT repeat protein
VAEDPIIRERAAISLGEIGDAKAEDPLNEVLNDVEPDVQSAAEEALEKIENAI